jgi:glycosidase
MVSFESDIFLPSRAMYRFYFSYNLDGEQKFIKKKQMTESDIYRDEMFKMAVNFSVPDWAKGKIMYHIFLDRFNRGSQEPLPEMPRRHIHKSWHEKMQIGPDKEGIWNNDFYGGDVPGITQKLDYIQSLGVSILYISPPVYSQSNHRYDTAEYENIDPYAGTNEDLKKLCDEAHKRGMKVVLDAVFNHTGSDSKYFNKFASFNELGAYQSEQSKYSNFFRKRYNSKTGKQEFDYWWGMDNLPVCNGDSPEWINYITGENGIIDQWFKLGIDGLRLDVADELTDYFIEQIKIAVERNKKDGFILGEVWKNFMRMNRGYISSGKGMHATMNYPLVDALMRYFKYADTEKLRWTISDIINEYPEESIYALMNFTSTHDISRPITVFGSKEEFSSYSEWVWDALKKDDRDYCEKFTLTKEEYEHAKEVYKAYVTTLAFMPGILSIFYGDEAGVEGLGNLSNRKTFPWGKEDQDLVEFFTSIGKIRLNNNFLEQATLNLVKINRDYLMFERNSNNHSAIIAVNRTDQNQPIELPEEYQDKEVIYTLKKSTKTSLSPYGAIAIKK